MAKATIVEPGLIQRKDEVKITRENIAHKLAEQYEKDHDMIEGEFISLEQGKNCFDFRFKKWKQDDYVQYSLTTRTRYTLPRMVVHHINHNIATTTYKDLPKEPGVKQAKISKDGVYTATENLKLQIRNPRCEFRPSSFDPYDDYINPPKIVDVSMHM